MPTDPQADPRPPRRHEGGRYASPSTSAANPPSPTTWSSPPAGRTAMSARSPTCGQGLKEPAVKNVHVEGMPNCDWVLIDSGDVIVHVFRPEVRDFYNLEKIVDTGHGDGEDGLNRRAAAIQLSACQRGPMRLVVIAVGRLKQVPNGNSLIAIAERFERYRPQAWLSRPRYPRNCGKPRRDVRSANREEAAAVARAGSRRDASWSRWTSAARISTAQHLRTILAAGAMSRCASTVFVIGGADGLSPELRRKAKLSVAFGAATWPHQMVRVMLLEQIYRAATILAGHPYHRD